MTWRDLGWRGAGVFLFAGACAAPLFGLQAPNWVIIHFAVAFTGLVLMLHGKRVAVMFRSERRRHGDTRVTQVPAPHGNGDLGRGD